MAEHWMQKAFPKKTRGRLHRALGVPLNKPIPPSMLAKAAKRRGKMGMRARAAMTASRISKAHARR